MVKSKKKSENSSKKSKEIKLKPVKIKFDKKEFVEKSKDLEESLEDDKIFQFDNVSEFLRSGKPSGLNVPVLPIENTVSSGVRFRNISREEENEKSNVSYGVGGNRNYLSGDNINDNLNNPNNQNATNNYRSTEPIINQNTNSSRMDLGELNSSDILRNNRSRERINPNQETGLNDDYSSVDKSYQSPTSIDIQEDNQRRVPGDRRRSSF